MRGLSNPGMKEMKAWCRALDAEIIRVARELKKKKIKQIFKKIWVEMGGDSASDRVAKRVKYIQQITEAYQADETAWSEEMRQLGLIK